jgi:hypothetical protein
MQILGEYRDDMVLVGGWVPFFLVGPTHTGSMDIDLALDKDEITEEVYKTVRRSLEEHGYKEGKQPYSFHREVLLDEGSPVVVQIDFLAGEYGGSGKNRRHQNIQTGLKARKARGCELALRHKTKISVAGRMPGGTENIVTITLSEVVPFIVMKGMALYDRMKEKDAWDIYFCVRNYTSGLDALAAQFRPLVSNRLVREGLGKIRSKFLTVDSYGPASVVAFEEVAERETREQIRRDAFEQITALLDMLGIDEFREL